MGDAGENQSSKTSLASRNRGFIPMIEAFELVLAISAAYFVVSGAIERLKY